MSEVQVGVGTTHAGEPLHHPARRRADEPVQDSIKAVVDYCVEMNETHGATIFEARSDTFPRSMM